MTPPANPLPQYAAICSATRYNAACQIPAAAAAPYRHAAAGVRSVETRLKRFAASKFASFGPEGHDVKANAGNWGKLLMKALRDADGGGVC
jgi:hypothetical protein